MFNLFPKNFGCVLMDINFGSKNIEIYETLGFLFLNDSLKIFYSKDLDNHLFCKKHEKLISLAQRFISKPPSTIMHFGFFFFINFIIIKSICLIHFLFYSNIFVKFIKLFGGVYSPSFSNFNPLIFLLVSFLITTLKILKASSAWSFDFSNFTLIFLLLLLKVMN